MTRVRGGIRATWVSTILVGLGSACAMGGSTDGNVPATGGALKAEGGWEASLVFDNGPTGIWTTGGVKVFPQYGCPEIYGLDDRGHCVLLSCYSGVWTPFQTVEDGEWLGALEVVDLDPTRPGEEIYVGGKKGNLYQVKAHREGGFDANVVARWPAREIHTMASGNLRPANPGNELIVYTHLGEVFEVAPARTSGHPFDTKLLHTTRGRVRQAIVLPAREDEAPWILCVSRAGQLLMHRLTADGLEERVVLEEPMGLGRLAVRRRGPGEPLVAYVSRDDGVILRVAEGADGTWSREPIYHGPQGPRGVAAGRFDADPSVETVAVFGYSRKVQLLSRRPGASWTVNDIFEDRDRGHWLSVIELDGRNATDELVGSGYGGRIFLLSRPPGYGLPGVPAGPSEPIGASPPPPRDGTSIRVGVLGDLNAVRTLSSLSYRGGFETKCFVYETPITFDRQGGWTSPLFERWESEADGQRWRFHLLPGRIFHDGTPIDADAVAQHFRRIARMPEHAWIGTAAKMREVRVVDLRTLEIELDAPHFVPLDLCAVNPFAVMAPTSRAPNGEFEWPIGSGPFRVVALPTLERPILGLRPETELPGARYRSLEIRCFAGTERHALYGALVGGEIDIVADRDVWGLPRACIEAARADPRVRVLEAPGSAVRYLCFNASAGPCAFPDVRRRIASSVDRAELCRALGQGMADPCEALFVERCGWPKRTAASAVAAGSEVRPLRYIVNKDSEGEAELAAALAKQLERAGFEVRIVQLGAAAVESAVARGEFDLRIGESWGIPYDPFLTLRAQFRGSSDLRTAVDGPPLVATRALAALIDAAQAEPDPARRFDAYRRIQEAVDTGAWIVPLLAPRRFAVVRSDLTEIPLDGSLYELDLRAFFGG